MSAIGQIETRQLIDIKHIYMLPICSQSKIFLYHCYEPTKSQSHSCLPNMLKFGAKLFCFRFCDKYFHEQCLQDCFVLDIP